jgi:DNA-binding transcriptional LysR family regulator
MLSSSNALFVFEAAARSGSFTRAAAELNVTQPAVSRMLARFEAYLGVKLFERAAKGAVLTEEGELLYRKIADGFRSIEAGLRELESRRMGAETITLSVSSAFTTHWLMPRMDQFRQSFPAVDLRFQLIAGSLRGPVENVDLGMRFVDRDEAGADAACVMHEAMLPICSPSYLTHRSTRNGNAERADTIINLVDSPGDWVDYYGHFGRARRQASKQITLSDYAVVVQAALLGQGIALGWFTVASHWLLTGALVPAADSLLTSRRVCELHPPRNLPVKPVAMEIRAWIIAQMRADIEAIDRLYPHLGACMACYGEPARPPAAANARATPRSR